MLAKKLKIRTLLRQRNYIEEQLNQIGNNEEVDPDYCHIGHIFQENIEYFKKEGFEITRVESDMFTAMAEGAPVYLFIPKDDIVLNKEEIKEAERYAEADELLRRGFSSHSSYSS